MPDGPRDPNLPEQPESPAARDTRAERDRRLAAQLRANLHRRKAQLRARADDPGEGPEGT